MARSGILAANSYNGLSPNHTGKNNGAALSNGDFYLTA